MKKSRNLTVKYRPIGDLIPYARNSRTHSDAQLEQIVRSITEFGWTNPVLIDEAGGIIAGHARVVAAGRLGMADVPCITLAGLTEAQKKAYVIADNKLALTAGWDEQLLALELKDLQGLDFDLELTGFSLDEVDQLFAKTEASAGLTDPDDVPEAPKEPVTRPGDLWILGKHRLLCGDSTNPQHVERLMGGVQPMLMVTDPPYLVDYDGLNHPSKWGHPDKNKDWSDKYGVRWNETGKDLSLWRDVFSIARSVLAENSPWYVWHADRLSSELRAILSDLGLLCHQVLIWKKNRPVLTRSWYMQAHEACIFGWIKGHKPPLVSKEQLTTVWEINHDLAAFGKTVHPTQKPVEIFSIPLRIHTNPGNVHYEPFSGSGSQIIASEQNGRRCFAMEIEPIYVDVAVTRWENFTGGKAQLEKLNKPRS